MEERKNLQELGLKLDPEINLVEPGTVGIVMQDLKEEIGRLKDSWGDSDNTETIKGQELLIKKLELALSLVCDDMVLLKHVMYKFSDEEKRNLNDREVMEIIKNMSAEDMIKIIKDCFGGKNMREFLKNYRLKHRDGREILYDWKKFKEALEHLKLILMTESVKIKK
ncbi:MAG: hypothetical protein A3D34_00840 [Candidatus Staskawiczbacteria bacterium RIFCSPHIGHO2_02_FULL_33_16]|uniref:Uncharacterized protein n=1 Tax=Candidatus Staskawiczbacteria bacterium RIFCSPHIGHO2_02_FULL_33_16 TaxID=1802204 RepID=A0A1G2HXV6_9BACT|nr:MAG: hypothetical protein A3D34_00840 [Candidatus Staskawiczbacteria bacterium RIFCSPHIGHO2_02_FULL_33_16]OGZ70470.1 MAG: hypothetical protein A2980_00765 [Candidatus Staskawiczbacteria bacterium RIFCSPLOWO2_01_FULL_33_13]